MPKGIKAFISAVVCIMLLFAGSIPAFAGGNNNGNTLNGFVDIQKSHWAYDQIMWLFERKIIEGVGNGLFAPNEKVTRAQFAKMMVLTLDLELYSPDNPSFKDVKKSNWEYSYVESAKPYLTGFRTSAGDYFRPSQTAVREDMAVALINALDYQNEPIDEDDYLDRFSDARDISPNLRKHVALSSKYGLIEGYTKNGRTVFDPQGPLTRAQAATLLYRAFKTKEEKVTYDDDEKVTYDDDDERYFTPSVSISTENGIPVLRWNRITSDSFKEYRIVISKDSSAPKYPQDGYLYNITDRDRTYAVINNSDKYSGGDFGNYLTKGEVYYFSVTAVYKDRNVAGNAVRFRYEGAENPEVYVIPIVSASEENGKLVLRWNKIDSPKLSGYRVVISKNDSLPSWPDNGSLYWITDRGRNYAVIDNTTEYTGGDFGSYLVKGEQYYFNVTAVYSDKIAAGNTITYTYNGEDHPSLFPAPVVSIEETDGKPVIKWNKIDSSRLKEYRVVISQYDQTPAYPENGFYKTALDKDTTSVAIDDVNYNNGDFSALTHGTEYYFSVTAVYENNKYVAGNVIKRFYFTPANP